MIHFRSMILSPYCTILSQKVWTCMDPQWQLYGTCTVCLVSRLPMFILHSSPNRCMLGHWWAPSVVRRISWFIPPFYPRSTSCAISHGESGHKHPQIIPGATDHPCRWMTSLLLDGIRRSMEDSLILQDYQGMTSFFHTFSYLMGQYSYHILG